MAPPHSAVTARRPLDLRRELARKALHLGAAAFPVGYSLGVPRRELETILATVVAVALVTELVRRASPAAGAVFARVFGSLTRGHEDRAITGATWLALSCLALVVLLSREAAIAALWCATVGDPAATVAGKVWTSMRAPATSGEGGKTFAGTFACAVASFVGVWLLAGYPPARAAFVAAAAALAEAMPISVDDNIRVAGAAGVVAQLLA
ncbi:MAG TPA: hypothetical protein VGI97_14940 [Gemmatimonadaceae bacterium]